MIGTHRAIEKKNDDQPTISVTATPGLAASFAVALTIGNGAFSSHIPMTTERARALGRGLLEMADYYEGGRRKGEQA